MDAATAAIGAAAVGAAVSLATLVVSKRLERSGEFEKWHREKRFQAYADLLTTGSAIAAGMGIHDAADKDMRAAIREFVRHGFTEHGKEIAAKVLLWMLDQPDHMGLNFPTDDVAAHVTERLDANQEKVVQQAVTELSQLSEGEAHPSESVHRAWRPVLSQFDIFRQLDDFIRALATVQLYGSKLVYDAADEAIAELQSDDPDRPPRLRLSRVFELCRSELEAHRLL